MSERSLAGKPLGDFELVERIGIDQVGELYSAKQLSHDRTVTVRVVDPELADRVSFRDQFWRDTKALTQAYHPNIVPPYGAGQSDGLLYVAMRHLPAMSLRTLISRTGPVDHLTAIEMLSQVADGLASVHEIGVFHRGLSSDRLLLRAAEKGDEVCVTDFAMTEETTTVGGVLKLPDQGARLPIDYLAPEQISGAPADARTDVYGLGCVLYEAVVGSPPFADRSGREKLDAHLKATPPSVRAANSELPEPLDEMITRALAKDPAERFQSAAEMAAASPSKRRVLTRWRAMLEAGTMAPGQFEPEPLAATVGAGSGAPGGGSFRTRLMAAAGSGSEGGGKGGEAPGEQEPSAGKGSSGEQGERAEKAGDAAEVEPQAPEGAEERGPEQRRSRRRRRAVAVGALAAAAAVTAGVLALAGAFESSTEPTAEAPPPPPPPAAVDEAEDGDRAAARRERAREERRAEERPAEGRLGPWPEGRSAYTAVVFALPADRAGAQARARQAAREGFRAGVLNSSDHPNLVPGVWVGFAGIYDSAEEASAAVERLRRAGIATQPYVRFIGS